MRNNERADHKGAHRAAYERNRKRILITQRVCGIGQTKLPRS